ncbi:MAG: tripartite tricarboxylate transporter substrate-binding protein, partial [Acidovorax sp.]|nr:tripartite tricarboxylate transporter substrate-binding protein [Acidovorax sp.]
ARAAPSIPRVNPEFSCHGCVHCQVKICKKTQLNHWVRGYFSLSSVDCNGVGASGHLACEMLAQRAAIKITTVPYKGGAPAITDVLGGHAHFLALNEVLPHIQDKRMKGLAVTSPKRSPFMPDLSSVSETLPGYDMVSWFGVFAPVGTPTDVVNKINTEIAIALKQPHVLEKFNSLGATPVGSTPKEFTIFVNSEIDRWGKIVKPMNIYID